MDVLTAFFIGIALGVAVTLGAMLLTSRDHS